MNHEAKHGLNEVIWPEKIAVCCVIHDEVDDKNRGFIRATKAFTVTEGNEGKTYKWRKFNG